MGLTRLCGCRGVLMVLTGLGGRDAVQRMLVANGVVSADGSWESGRGCPAFDSMDAAMVWCEEHFKQVRAPSLLPLVHAARSYCPVLTRNRSLHSR